VTHQVGTNKPRFRARVVKILVGRVGRRCARTLPVVVVGKVVRGRKYIKAHFCAHVTTDCACGLSTTCLGQRFDISSTMPPFIPSRTSVDDDAGFCCDGCDDGAATGSRARREVGAHHRNLLQVRVSGLCPQSSGEVAGTSDLASANTLTLLQPFWTARRAELNSNSFSEVSNEQPTQRLAPLETKFLTGLCLPPSCGILLPL
jgi:hypothetical protein